MDNLTKNQDNWQNTWNHFKNGDREAFGKIYDEYVDSLYDYGIKITPHKELVKDCIQDLFIDLYRYGNKLNTPISLEFYLYKSLKRLIVKKARNNYKLVSLQEFENPELDIPFSHEGEMLQNESRSSRLVLLQNIINELDSQKKELLYLKFNSGLNYSEIGDIVGLKTDTVKKQIYRLIDSIRNNYGSKLMELYVLYFKA